MDWTESSSDGGGSPPPPLPVDDTVMFSCPSTYQQESSSASATDKNTTESDNRHHPSNRVGRQTYQRLVEKFRTHYKVHLFTSKDIHSLRNLARQKPQRVLGPDSGLGDSTLTDSPTQENMEIYTLGFIQSCRFTSDEKSLSFQFCDVTDPKNISLEVPVKRFTEFVGNNTHARDSNPTHENRIVDFLEFDIGDILVVHGMLNFSFGDPLITPLKARPSLFFFRTFTESYLQPKDMDHFSQSNSHIEKLIPIGTVGDWKALFGIIEDEISDQVLMASWKGKLMKTAHKKSSHVVCHPFGVVMAAKFKEGQEDSSNSASESKSISLYLHDPTGIPFDTSMVWQKYQNTSADKREPTEDSDENPMDMTIHPEEQLFNANPWDRFRINPDSYIGSEWVDHRLLINVWPPGRLFSVAWTQPRDGGRDLVVALNTKPTLITSGDGDNSEETTERARCSTTPTYQLDLKRDESGALRLVCRESLLGHKFALLEDAHRKAMKGMKPTNEQTLNDDAGEVGGNDEVENIISNDLLQKIMDEKEDDE